MSKIKKLENIKLLKELEFIESEFDYKNEIILEADSNFIKTINAYLEVHPELKKIFDESIDKKFEKMIKSKQDKDDLSKSDPEQSIDKNIEDEFLQIKNDDVDIIESPKNLKLKKLFREIVKQTHPDKVKNKKMNSIYIQAAKYYEDENILGIYNICNELNIEYELDDTDNVEISTKIFSLKDRIKFLESTFTWKWLHSDDPKEKESIIIKYISSQIS